MDKDEAIKWLDNISDNGWTKTSNAEAQSMCRAISQLLKEQPQWIPISVEKPKCKGDYIVTRWVSVECTKKMLSDIAYFNGTDTWYDDCYTVYDPDRIVAWMSLPEPYRTGI